MNFRIRKQNVRIDNVSFWSKAETAYETELTAMVYSQSTLATPHMAPSMTSFNERDKYGTV